VQQSFTMRREFDQNLSLILIAVPAAHRASFNQAIYQFDGAVVAKAKLLGEHGDGGTSAPR
jgi:hypothetical protein